MFCKLDSVMGNEKWMDEFSDALVNFLPEGEFNHSSAMLALDQSQQGGKDPLDTLICGARLM